MGRKTKKNSNQHLDAYQATTEKFISFQIKIIDTGMGISKEGLEQLFMDFGKL